MNKLLRYLMNQPSVEHRILPGLQKFQKGGQPCYECGGSVKRYDAGGFYDCPDQEKDPETGKCKAEVVRGREAAAANKAAAADMNAWAKQVAAIDKENAKQNAAQIAGQLSFDYDWMQSPLDKADKKAAIAQYKQFFQQNPNTFVPDDTSGYSPEQKYIIASKLKQRLSTPMGSKLAQQKLGVDPRYYDLQRMQAELAPKMGGWEGMRNFLFNVYKEEGGPILDPRMQRKGIPTVYEISKMPEKRYTPSPAVMNTKAGLAAAGMVSGPLSFIPGTAAAVYDLGTAARYAMDGQWDNAKEDLISAGLSAIPTAGVYSLLAGMGKLQKAARARAAIRSAKTAMNVKDIAGSSTIRNNTTGLVQEFDKAGNEISSMRPRSVTEVKNFNQNLKRSYRTEATPEVPEHLRPYENFYANGGMITDPMGQWAHPGKNTRIPGSNITMQGVPYPVLAKANNGMTVLMQPGQDYSFDGADYVDEYPMMKGGGYVVTRSNDRKGKTHKVTGPDGTVKYFGDSKLGQHPKDPQRKAAFYARHKKNLANNPYFRAFARKTWEEGGEIDDDREMLSGVADILRRVKDVNNRKELANYMMNNFREEDVTFEPDEFLESSNVFAKGGEMIRRADGSYSRRGLWDNIRANKGSGKKPTKEMLEQEKKINMKKYRNGGTSNPGFEALPEYVQAKILSNMGYGGYYNPMMAQGGSTFSGNAWYKDGGDYKSVADYAKASGRGSSFKDRKEIAEQVGITGYKGTAAQNKALLERLMLSDSKNVVHNQIDELVNPETGESEYLDNSYTESDGLRDLRLQGIRSAYDDLQKRNTVLPQPKTKAEAKAATQRVQGTTIPSRYIAAPGPFDYLNNPIMNYLRAPMAGSKPASVVYEDAQPTKSNVKIPAYDPYPFRNAGNNSRRQEMTDIESTPDVDFAALQQVYRSANPGAIDANELSRRGRTSLNSKGNMMYAADADMTGAEVMQRKMAAGAYGDEAAKNALRTNPNNPLAAFTQYMTGMAAEPFLGVGTGGLKIATGRGNSGDVLNVALATIPAFGKYLSKMPTSQLKNIVSTKQLLAELKAGNTKLEKEVITNPELLKALQEHLPDLQSYRSAATNWFSNDKTRKALNAARKQGIGYAEGGFVPMYATGGIHINPANKGKFTASANAAGMGVQEFASHVLANKEDYSSTQVKRANFAHNAAGWNKAEGGEIMDVTPEELEILRQQGYQFEIL